MDSVKPCKDVETRWTLHTVNEPVVDGMIVRTDNGKGRLFCRTLLPEDAIITKVGGFQHKDQKGKNETLSGVLGNPEHQLGGWRIDVMSGKSKTECAYLHVLFPSDTTYEKMPECKLKKLENKLTIQVGEWVYSITNSSAVNRKGE